MKKWIEYAVIVLLFVLWCFSCYGFFYCMNYLPMHYESDDLQAVCFGIGFFFWPFIFGFCSLVYNASKYFVYLFKRWFFRFPSSGSR